MVTTGSAAQNPSPIARIVRSFVMCSPLACADCRSRKIVGGSSGLFHDRTKAAVLQAGLPIFRRLPLQMHVFKIFFRNFPEAAEAPYMRSACGQGFAK
jgi:hypothetical protein